MIAWIIGLSVVAVFFGGLVAAMLYVSHEATEYETQIYGEDHDSNNGI